LLAKIVKESKLVACIKKVLQLKEVAQ